MKRRNVLAVGAHFDDVELGLGGTIAKHTELGDNVFVYVLTESGYTDISNNLIRNNIIALQEGKRAAKILGVRELIIGQYKTLNLQYNDSLICSLKRALEKYSIDTLYTHWHDDIHQDHYAVSRASLTAARHIPNILMYRSNWYKSTMEFNQNYYVDISDHIKVKIKAIMAHRSEYERVGKKWIEFFTQQNRNDGIKLGVKYAECFEVVRLIA